MNPSDPNQQPAYPAGMPMPSAAPGQPYPQPYPTQQPAYPPVAGQPATVQPQAYPQPGTAPVQQQYAPPAPNMGPTPSAMHYAAPGAPQVVAPATGQPAAPPVRTSNPNSTQNTLQMAEIRDGIVIMNDGTYRSVVMVKSVNFDLMSPQEQESIEYSFQGFLNSLYFPVQIFIRSQKVDLRPYIEKLDKIRSEHDNMLLALLMEDYITYIDDLSQQTNIMDKKFYVVVPFFPNEDIKQKMAQSKNFIGGLSQLFSKQEQHVVINEHELEQAKTELRNRVQAVMSGLLQSGVQGLPLDTQELIELYYDTYNPDTATRQQLKNFDDLSADVVTKGTGATVQPHLQRELQ